MKQLGHLDVTDARAATSPPPAPSSAEDVARAIGDTLELPQPPLRVPVGDAATQLLAARASMGDAEFDTVVRSVFTPTTW